MLQLDASRRARAILLSLLCPALAAAPLQAQTRDSLADRQVSAGTLKRLTIEQLMNVEVSSVSRRAERLSQAAAAVQVLSGELIRRSGAATLPEALRFASNLQLQQSTGYEWAVTTRGFNTPDVGNSPRANKMLVLIDGRTVYTPLFGGVLWDAQSVLLEDVERIEVISGPGGALWGANAVNGVINVITRNAASSTGWYASARAGSLVEGAGALRYGTRLGANGSVRVYGQHLSHGSSILPDSTDAPDSWRRSQGGFRADWKSGTANTFTLQGDAYRGREGFSETEAGTFDGQNLLGRWSHTFSPMSELRVQGYIDRTWRQYPDVFADQLTSYDLDVQHGFAIGDRHTFLWGAGARVMQDRISNGLFVLDPADRTLQLYSMFAQDEIGLVPDRLALTLGAKVEHNSYTGFEIQPSVRAAWAVTPRQTIWGGVSRAVRSPSRADREFAVPLLGLISTGEFRSEAVTAYELGYRAVLSDALSFSVSTFVNEYRDLRSTNMIEGSTFLYANDVRGRTWGGEATSTAQVTPWWRVRVGYTHLNTDLETTSADVIVPAESEANDPADQIMVRSVMDIAARWQFDLTTRHVSALPGTTAPVDAYTALDARLAWRSPRLEIALIGQGLTRKQQVQLGVRAIPRSVSGQVVLRW